MRLIKATAVAAIIAATSAGSASATPGFLDGSVVNKLIPSEIKGSWANKLAFSESTAVSAVQIIGGSFVAWTVYRFFQNCGPFRC